MARCLDCKGGVPAPLWKRCIPCATKVLRILMSGGEVTTSPAARRYARGDNVFVGDPVGKEGVVTRSRLNTYTVTFTDGTRAYVQADQMRDLKEEKSDG